MSKWGGLESLELSQSSLDVAFEEMLGDIRKCQFPVTRSEKLLTTARTPQMKDEPHTPKEPFLRKAGRVHSRLGTEERVCPHMSQSVFALLMETALLRHSLSALPLPPGARFHHRFTKLLPIYQLHKTWRFIPTTSRAG